MSTQTIRIRANKSTGELELEGELEIVDRYWEKLWPQVSSGKISPVQRTPMDAPEVASQRNDSLPELFGEFLGGFQSGITNVDKALVAAAFVQSKDTDRSFTTNAMNQILLEQGVKLGNPSECVRRLTQTKRAFVVSGGKFRVSATGFEHLNSLKSNSAREEAS